VDPRVLEAVHQALLEWQFELPMVDGKPFAARVLQPFRFFATESSGS